MLQKRARVISLILLGIQITFLCESGHGYNAMMENTPARRKTRPRNRTTNVGKTGLRSFKNRSSSSL
jgi:hypothetical protein